MKVICEELTCRELPPPLVISQPDDAWHPLNDRNYVEWWYFDVMNKDGGIVRGHFYISGNISRPRTVRTGVRASYVKPDGTESQIDEKFHYSSFKSSTEVCEVQIGDNFIKGDLSHYKLHIADGDKSLDLELDSDIKGIKSYAYFGDETKYMFWVVPQPRGHAKGTFRTKDETFDIEGLGYRDHNWWNFFPMDIIEYWDWGRVYDTEFTVIFADIVTTRRFANAEIKPLLIYDPDRLLYLTTEPKKWSLTKTDIEYDTETQTAYPQTYTVKARDEGLLLDMDLHLKKVFQRIDPLADFNPLVRFLISTFKGKPAITSFFSLGSGKLDFSGRENTLTCTAVHELVRNI